MTTPSALVLHSLFVLSLLVLSAFFSGSEAAFFSLPTTATQRFQTATKGAPRRVANLLRDRQALLITLLLGNLVVNLLATSRATELLVGALGPRAGSWIAWLGMTIVVLVAGEITPKVVAVQRPERWALGSGRILQIICILVAPVRIIIARIVGPITSGWYRERRALVERAELQTAIEETAAAGGIHPFDAEVVLALLDLEDVRVREVMTPRVHIRGVAEETPATELPRAIRRLRRTRLPVYAGSLDVITGMLYVHDLLGAGESERSSTARDLARPVLFVPENLTLDRLLIRFRAERTDIAVVMDEFGSVAGLVTIHDVVDEVFGPVPDRHDPASPAMVPTGDGSWMVPGILPLDVIRDMLGVDIHDPLVETIGGRVAHVVGRIPAQGEVIELPEGLAVHVTRADSRRILELRVTRTDSGDHS